MTLRLRESSDPSGASVDALAKAYADSLDALRAREFPFTQRLDEIAEIFAGELAAKKTPEWCECGHGPEAHRPLKGNCPDA